MPLYEKPIWQLMGDAVAAQGETFTTDEILRWFNQEYPKIKESSLRAHIVGMTVNNPTRRYYAGTLDHGILYRLGRSLFTRYDATLHGHFSPHGKQVGVEDDGEDVAIPTPSTDVLDDDDQVEAVAEFALEQHLEEFMERNWSSINFGRPLEVWRDDSGVGGRQYQTTVGRIDFLCRDRDTGSFVVVELKKGRTSDVVVGQTQRYMGWVKQNLETEGRPVFGLIIGSEVDDRLKYALDVAPNIRAREYRLQFELADPSEGTGQS